MHQKGTWYFCELQINGQFFDGRSLDQVEKTIAHNLVTVCNSLDDCVLHESVHARSTLRAFASVVRKYNEKKGIPEISVTAGKDMLEALAEVGVLKEKGLYDTISEGARKKLDEAAKELGLW